MRRIAPNVPEYNLNWELPGGKIEAGETPEEAIQREVAEETGYLVTKPSLLPINYTADLPLMDPPLNVDVDCGKCELAGASVGDTTSSDPKPTQSGSHEYRWFRFAEIPYSQIIPGSREFILWAAHRRGEAIPHGASLYALYMESVDFSQNRKRSYNIELTYLPSESDEPPSTQDQEGKGPFVVTIESGRIQQLGQRARTIRYESMDLALEEVRRRVRKRKSHRYAVVTVQANHPLRSWLSANGVPHEDSAIPTLF